MSSLVLTVPYSNYSEQQETHLTNLYNNTRTYNLLMMSSQLQVKSWFSRAHVYYTVLDKILCMRNIFFYQIQSSKYTIILIPFTKLHILAHYSTTARSTYWTPTLLTPTPTPLLGSSFQTVTPLLNYTWLSQEHITSFKLQWIGSSTMWLNHPKHTAVCIPICRKQQLKTSPIKEIQPTAPQAIFK